MNYNISKSQKKWKESVGLEACQLFTQYGWADCCTPEAGVDHRLPSASHVTLAYVSFLAHCRASSWLVWPVTITLWTYKLPSSGLLLQSFWWLPHPVTPQCVCGVKPVVPIFLGPTSSFHVFIMVISNSLFFVCCYSFEYCTYSYYVCDSFNIWSLGKAGI